jgi:4-alpha-glucanotransferase
MPASQVAHRPSVLNYSQLIVSDSHGSPEHASHFIVCDLSDAAQLRGQLETHPLARSLPKAQSMMPLRNVDETFAAGVALTLPLNLASPTSSMPTPKKSSSKSTVARASARTKREDTLPLFNWLKTRGAGVLLHPTCFPSNQGCGVLDGNVTVFLDFLKAAGIKYWQVCPLGPTGYGDSPYQCFSAFAGNPYLVDLWPLVHAGLLTSDDLQPLASLPSDHVDYGALYQLKPALLAKAHAAFQSEKPTLPYGDFNEFCTRHAHWLEAYAYYRALKDHFNGIAWWEWPATVRDFTRAQKSPLRTQLADAIASYQFGQYLFFGQWAEVRASARTRGIEIIGDLPIFVAGDSADAWSNPELFELDPKTLQPLAVAGVPPDYFSADGQLWGNPLYRWEAHQANGYQWWLARMSSSFELCDIVRIDHFRGFDQYWRIPAPATTARVGAWTAGPGLDLFRAFKASFPEARIIAEDLGALTESVHELLRATGLPGMLVLQFAWASDATNSYLPHNATQNSVIYPGTHDNDTTTGWYRNATEVERDYVRRYLRVSGDDVAWDFIRAAYASTSRLAIISLQDVFALDSSARFNTPAIAEGNWQWRYRADALETISARTASYLNELAKLCGR